MDTRSLWLVAAVFLAPAGVSQTPQKLDINPNGSSSPQFITSFGDRVLFVAFTPKSGLWISDGTSNGTRQIKGPTSVSGHIEVLHGLAYFSADDGRNGTELWVTDGTDNGTRMYLDIYPGRPPSSPQYLERIGNLIYFSASDGSGSEPWVTDGNTANPRQGTRRIFDINPGRGSSRPREFAGFPGRVVFQADNGVHGPELWVTDGTGPGTNILIFRPNGPPSVASGMTAVRSSTGKQVVVFSAQGLARGKKLWVTDFTRQGTVPLKVKGSEVATPRAFVRGRHSAYFVGAGGKTIYYTDGSSAGTGGLFSRAGVEYLTVVGSDHLYFSGRTANGTEPVRLRTASMTFTEYDINPKGSSNPRNGATFGQPFAVAGSKVFFQATTTVPKVDRELWVIDNGATKRTVAWGCGAAWADADDPRLGNLIAALTSGIHGVTVPVTFVAMLSVPSPGLPFIAHGARGCRFHLHPGILAALPPRNGSNVGGGQQTAWTVGIPNDPGLLDQTALTQTAAFVPSTNRLELSNAVRLRVGR